MPNISRKAQQGTKVLLCLMKVHDRATGRKTVYQSYYSSFCLAQICSTLPNLQQPWTHGDHIHRQNIRKKQSLRGSKQKSIAYIGLIKENFCLNASLLLICIRQLLSIFKLFTCIAWLEKKQPKNIGENNFAFACQCEKNLKKVCSTKHENLSLWSAVWCYMVLQKYRTANSQLHCNHNLFMNTVIDLQC